MRVYAGNSLVPIIWSSISRSLINMFKMSTGLLKRFDCSKPLEHKLVTLIFFGFVDQQGMHVVYRKILSNGRDLLQVLLFSNRG